jgi:branched-subunit amino acid permease
MNVFSVFLAAANTVFRANVGEQHEIVVVTGMRGLQK